MYFKWRQLPWSLSTTVPTTQGSSPALVSCSITCWQLVFPTTSTSPSPQLKVRAISPASTLPWRSNNGHWKQAYVWEKAIYCFICFQLDDSPTNSIAWSNGCQLSPMYLASYPPKDWLHFPLESIQIGCSIIWQHSSYIAWQTTPCDVSHGLDLAQPHNRHHRGRVDLGGDEQSFTFM